MQSREIIQAQATKAIIDANHNGIIHISPRVGKSKIVCDAIRGALKSKWKILITVPFNSIIDSWNTEFTKWKITKPQQKYIKVINQRNLSKETLTDYDIIICDEIHTLSNAQLSLLKDVRKNYMNSGINILGVSGSISTETEKILKKELNIIPIYTYSIEDAIKDKIVANYEIILVPIQLDSKNKYIEAGTKDKKFMTTEAANYQYLTAHFEKMKRAAWSNKSLEVVKMQAASKRANFIYNCNSKVDAVKKIIDKYERCLIFTARTEIADTLSDGNGYHSKSSSDVLDKFMSGDINKLGVCEMTNMGITFPNLKVGIFHQMKSNDESAIQKVMRMCNLEGDETARIYITYYTNTVDEQWITKALEGFDNTKITKL